MSLKVMHWAWSIALPPAPKLLLMALADEADDGGFCFPSVPHLAKKCSVAERSVQRIIGRLTRDGFVSIEQRFRKNRARTSNGYRLAVDRPPPNCHRAPEEASGVVTPVSGGGRHSDHRGGDTRVGVTTTGPSIYPKPQPPGVAEPNGGPADHKRRAGSDLCFPNVVSKAQEHALGRQLLGLSPIDAQQVLDELAGRMKASQVRDPVRYCAALVGRLKRGEFQPELGLAVSRYRDVQRQLDNVDHEQRIAPDISATSAANRLPDCIRLSLERMRQRTSSEPPAVDSGAGPSSDPRTNAQPD